MWLRVDVRGDTTYATPDKDKAAAEGGEGEYSYAATTTVIGAKHSKPEKKPDGEMKIAYDVSAQPDKPKSGSNKHSPPADVPHKQGPVGDLYAMPDKKAQEVERKPGPQGDMYALAAKSKVSDQVNLLFAWHCWYIVYAMEDCIHLLMFSEGVMLLLLSIWLIYCDVYSCQAMFSNFKHNISGLECSTSMDIDSW